MKLKKDKKKVTHAFCTDLQISYVQYHHVFMSRANHSRHTCSTSAIELTCLSSAHHCSVYPRHHCSALQLLPNHFPVQVQSVLRLLYVLFSPERSNCLMFSANGKCSQWACWCAVISNTSHHETRLTGLSRRRQQILWQESAESTSLFPVKVDVCCRNSRTKPHKQFEDLSF